MAWLSRNDFTPEDSLHSDDLNNLANDQRAWGGDVNGGGHHLSNVIIDGYFPGGVGTPLLSITHVIPASGDPSSWLSFDGSPGGNPARWRIGHDNAAESGANAGSNFAIARYSDAGALIDQPITVRRSDGLITMGAQQWTGNVNGGGHTLSNVTIAGVLADPTTTKGDLLARGAAALTRLAVGPDGQVLTADSTQATGVKWAAPAGAVSSVFTRTGAVVAAAGDYTAAQVTNAVSILGSYADPAWITALAWAKITGTPALIPTTRRVNAGAGLSGGGALSADVTLTAVPMGASGSAHAAGIVPDPGATLGGTRYLREDATWAVPSGTGGGLTDPTTTLGDLIVRGSAAITRLGVGTNGQVLTADSTQPTGVKWAAASGGGGSQTPWTSDINAAGFNLNGVLGIGVGAAALVNTAVYINTPTIFDSFKQTNSSSAGWAGFNFQNDLGHTLHVALYGSTRATPDIARIEMSNTDLAFAYGSAEVFRFTATGRLGIGTAAPSNALHVYSPALGSALRVIIQEAGASGANLAGISLQTAGANWFIDNRGTTDAPNNRLAIGAGGADLLTILTSGNVGIGNATPTYKLDVTGDINCSGAYRVAGAALLPPTKVWTAVTYQNSWADFGGGYAPVAYALGPLGMTVMFRGIMHNGVNADGTVAFTLPAGFRPVYTLELSVGANTTSATAVLKVNPDGTCAVYGLGGQALAVILDGWQFPIF